LRNPSYTLICPRFIANVGCSACSNYSTITHAGFDNCFSFFFNITFQKTDAPRRLFIVIYTHANARTHTRTYTHTHTKDASAARPRTAGFARSRSL
jgi:hypothetical protein